MTVYRISCCTWRSPHIAPADLPTEWQFHRFLLWQLIFHSYSENLSFGRPDLGRSNLPPIQWWFHRFLCNSYFIPTLRAQHLADQVLADLPPIKWQFHKFLLWQFHISFLLWQLHIWQTRSWQMYPHLSGNFTDSYSDNSYFILTLRAYHLADQVLAYLPPIKWQFHRFLLWQLTFHDSSYFIPTLRAQTFGRPGLGRSTPIWAVISLIPTLTTLISFLLWELIIWQTRSWHIYPPIQ